MSDLAKLILGIAGVILSLIFTYFPPAKAWLDKQSNKGLIMLGFVALVAVAYFALSCTPLAAQLHIAVSCNEAGAFAVAEALFWIASGNQLTYLFTQPGTAK